MLNRWIQFSAVCVLWTVGLAEGARKITYQEHIKPIFQNHCFNCHNADKSKAGLDLTSYGAAVAGSSGGQVLEAGNAQDSILYLVVTHQEEPAMPLEQDKLTDEQIELIRSWIAGGLLESGSSKARKPKKPAFDIALSQSPAGRPQAPPPMPQHLLLEPAALTERSGPVAAIAANPWAPLAAVSGQKQVLLYHTETLELAGVLPFPEGSVQRLAFSRSGTLLLAGGGRGGQSGRVVLWNVADGQRVTKLGEELDAVLGADLRADQTQVALGGPARLIKVHSTVDGHLAHTIKKHTEWVTAVAYSPDGVLLATGDRNGALMVWEAHGAGEFHSLGGHGGAITALSWRDDSNILASTGEDGRIRLWEMSNGKQVKNWGAHGGGVSCVHFGHDGRLVSSGRDRHLRLWDQNGKQIKAFGPFDDIAMQAAFTHDGKRVIGGDWSGQIRVWNVEDGNQVGMLQGNPPSLARRLADATNRVGELQPALAKAAATLEQVETEAAGPRELLAAAGKAADEEVARQKQAKATANQRKAELAKVASAHTKATELAAAKKAQAKKLAEVLAESTAEQQKATALHVQSKDTLTSRTSLAETLAKAADAAQAEHKKDPDDAKLTRAAENARIASQAAQGSLAVARKFEADLGKKTNELKQTVEVQNKQVVQAAATLQQVQEAVSKSAKALEAAKTTSAAARKDLDQVNATAAEATAALEKVTAETRPFQRKVAAALEAHDQLSENLKAAQIQVARWKAQQVNVRRLAARTHWQSLQAQHSEVAFVANQAQSANEQAVAALGAARAAMADAPAVVEQKNQLLAEAEKFFTQALGAVDAARAIVTDKEGFFKQMDQTAAELARRAAKETKNQTLAQALQKARDAASLLKQDVDGARQVVTERDESRIAAEAKVDEATAASQKARADLAEAPKIVQQRDGAAGDLKAKLEKARADEAESAKIVADARTVFDELMQQYLTALPEQSSTAPDS